MLKNFNKKKSRIWEKHAMCIESLLGWNCYYKTTHINWHLTGLALLNVRDCNSLACQPSTLFNLKLLKDINISRCSKLKRLPKNVGNVEKYREVGCE